MTWLFKWFIIMVLWGVFHNYPGVAFLGTLLIIFWPVTEHSVIHEQLAHLTLLRLELTEQHQRGHLETTRYQKLIQEIDDAATTLLQKTTVSLQQRNQQLENIWHWLNETRNYNLGGPPWRDTFHSTTPTAPLPKASPSSDLAEPPQSSPTVLTSSPKSSVMLKTESLTQTTTASPPEVKPTAPAVSSPTAVNPISTAAETPKSKLPKLLSILRHPLSTIHYPLSTIILPFLWQNLGWFIGGFCFVSGSIFLVTYTTGFFKALSLFLVLNLYTIMLFGGGYQLRRRRPELAASSQALFILGVLLVPLNFAAGVRLIENGVPHLEYVSFSLLLSGLVVGGLAWATTLATGVLDRSLLGKHPHLFISLAALQFALPLLHWFPNESILAGLHLGLLALLGHALSRFVQQWLHNIFVERQQLTYYVAGSLVYAASVSFIHLTWGSQISLPPGYAGAFLLALCGLLFYVDIHLKSWVHQQALLSYFTFVIYGLSILALTIALLGHTPLTIHLALILGMLLYGAMVWHYLTWPPLYLLLACFSGLYALVILRHFPHQWHFLLSLPGLMGILAIRQWAEQRQAAGLATITYRVMVLLAVSAWGWSLYQTPPGLAAVLTTAIATVLAFQTLRFTSSPYYQLLPKAMATYQGYLFTGLATLTLFYTPSILGLDSLSPEPPLSLANGLVTFFLTRGNFYQFTYGLVVLAAVWIAWGLQQQKFFSAWSITDDDLSTAHATRKNLALVFLNSGLLSMLVSVTFLIVVALPQFTMSPLLLAVMGSLLLWLSLSLYSRGLFYVVLLIGMVAGEQIKHQYLPPSSGSGAGILGIAMVIGIIVWYLQRFQTISAILTDSEVKPPRHLASLLGVFPIILHKYANRADLVLPPLRQLLNLLWLVGLFKIGSHWLPLHHTTSNLMANGLGALVTILIAGQHRQLWLLPLAIMLLIGSQLILGFLWLPSVITPWLFPISAGYALLIWWAILWLLTPPRRWVKVLDWEGGYNKNGGRWLTEQVVQSTVLVIQLGSVVLALISLFFLDQRELASINLSSEVLPMVLPMLMPGKLASIYVTSEYLPLLVTLGIFIVFLWHAGTRYRFQLHSYLLIASVSLANIFLSSWWLGKAIPFLIQTHLTTVLITVWTLGLAGLAYLLNRFPKWQWQTLYGIPLYHTILVFYCAILLNSLTILVSEETPPIWLSGVFLLLTVGNLPLTLTWPAFPTVRGISMPLLLTATVVSVLLALELPINVWLITGWSVTLWVIGNYLLPRFNQRWPHWAIWPTFWPLLGFLIMLGLLFQPLITSHHLPDGSIFLLATFYFLLMLRTTKDQKGWEWLPWLIVLSVNGIGVSILMNWLENPALITLGILIWLNLLLSGTLICQHYDKRFPTWGWQRLVDPFFIITFSVWLVGLVILGTFNLYEVTISIALNFHQIPDISIFFVVISVLLNLSLLHAMILRPMAITANSFLVSLVNTGLLLVNQWLPFSSQGEHLPMLLMGWTTGLWLLYKAIQINPASRFFLQPRLVLATALNSWFLFSGGLTVLGLMLFFVNYHTVTVETLAVLAILSGFSVLQSRPTSAIPSRLPTPFWLAMGLIWFLGICYLAWFLWLPDDRPLTVLLPWYALQSSVLFWLLLLTKHWTTQAAWDGLSDGIMLLLGGLSLLTWGGHLFLLVNDLFNPNVPLVYLFGKLDQGAMILTGLLLLIQWWLVSQGEWRIYGSMLLLAILGGYTRFLWRGLIPLDVWDTTSILAASYVLLVIQRLSQSTSWNRLTLLIPLSALLTIPLQLNSVHASGTLLATAALYLLMQRRAGQNLSVYLGLLALNAGIYLWVPDLATHYKLLWIYTVPVSITVLMMLQLHILELKQSVIHATRLTALSTLYASATLDVFLRPELSIFFLILGLSLAGLVLGIALKTRAFLYTGTVFLVLNVIGQLMHLYPEGRLEKAILLITVGAIITGGMIWFNIQREALLQRIRIMRADLANWE